MLMDFSFPCDRSDVAVFDRVCALGPLHDGLED